MSVLTASVLRSSIAFWGFLLIQGVKALPFKSCTDDQYRRLLPNGSAVCIDCLRCPVGLGPSVECGSTIAAETVVQCLMCKAGVSYSTNNDFEQCEPCSVCSEDQVSKHCTPTSDTVCEKRCKSKGKYYEESSDDCQDCTWCCGDDKDIKIDECLKKGMPAQKSCTVHRRKFCKAPPSTTEKASPTYMHPVTSLPPTKLIAKFIIDSRIKTAEKELTNVTAKKILPNNKTSQEYSSQGLSARNTPTLSKWIQVTIITVVCVGACILLVVSLVCLLIIYRKKSKNCTSSEQSPETLGLIYTLKGDRDTIIAKYKDSRLFELFESHHQMKDVVCDKLDLQKSFAKLARAEICKMNEDKVKKLEEQGIIGPTRQVFDWMETAKPNFLFGDFISILKEIERNDVVKCCVEKLKERHVQLESNRPTNQAL